MGAVKGPQLGHSIERRDLRRSGAFVAALSDACHHTNLVQTASLLRADVIFGKDRGTATVQLGETVCKNGNALGPRKARPQ